MKRLMMMLVLVALAIPATAFAAGPGDGTCTFTKNDKNKTMTLVADCTTATTIRVPNGYTLDGNGHKITAIDRAAAFVGAVVENEGATMNVKNLTVTVDSAALEQLRCRQRRRLHIRERLDQRRHTDPHLAEHPGRLQ